MPLTLRELLQQQFTQPHWTRGQPTGTNLILGNTQAATLNIAVLILLRQP